MMINNLNEVKRNDNVTVRKISQKYYVTVNRKCFQLNETGILILKYTGKDMSIDEFCEKMVKKYDNKEMFDKVKEDTIEFINFLVEQGMLIME